MEKKSIVLHIALFSLIAFWIFLVGQVGQSIFAGSINLIDEGQFLAWVMRMQKWSSYL